jgi:hypothetical protein
MEGRLERMAEPGRYDSCMKAESILRERFFPPSSASIN